MLKHFFIAISLIFGAVLLINGDADSASGRLCEARGICHKVAAICSNQATQVTKIFTVGTSSFIIPTGVTTLSKVVGYGAGGGGGNGGDGSGGGGGAYAEVDNFSVTPGNTISFTIGVHGNGGAQSTSDNSGTLGGDTTVTYSAATVVLAKGGGPGNATGGGAGGLASGSTGNVKNNGGTGGTAPNAAGGGGGGAGGGAGAGVNGANGSLTVANGGTGVGGAGGAGDNGSGGTGGTGGPVGNNPGGNGMAGNEFSGGGSGGGGGGAGGDGATTGGAGGVGGQFGGGGAGGEFGSPNHGAGGNGGDGGVVLTYTVAGCVAPPPPPSGTFFIATAGGGGSDQNDGLAPITGGGHGPFLTFGQCQAAMRAQASNGIKTCTIRAGTYNFASILVLTASDNGETWQYYTADGFNTAILDGGSTNSGTGINGLILISGGSNITINGLQVQHANAYGLAVHGGAAFESLFPTAPNVTGNTIKNTIILSIFNNTAITNTFNQGCVIIEGNAQNTKVLNNVCHDSLDNGIRAGANDDGNTPGDNISGTDIENNVVYNIGGSNAETAGIYTEDGTLSGTVLLGGICGVGCSTNSGSSGTGGQGSSNITIKHNLIFNYGQTAGDQGRGIYLDEGSSNETITQNIVGPPGPGNNNGGGGLSTMFMSTGNNNTVQDNIFDLGSVNPNPTITVSFLIFGASKVAYSGNSHSKNIIVSNFAGASSTSEFGCNGQAYIGGTGTGGIAGNNPSVGPNAYHNYGGATENTSGCGGPTASDSNPQHITAANLKCSGYVIDPTSQAVTGVVGFTPIALTNLGPPGFTLPPISPASSC